MYTCTLLHYFLPSMLTTKIFTTSVLISSIIDIYTNFSHSCFCSKINPSPPQCMIYYIPGFFLETYMLPCAPPGKYNTKKYMCSKMLHVNSSPMIILLHHPHPVMLHTVNPSYPVVFQVYVTSCLFYHHPCQWFHITTQPVSLMSYKLNQWRFANIIFAFNTIWFHNKREYSNYPPH